MAIQVFANLSPMISGLNKLGGKLTNPGDALEEIGEYFVGRVERNFRTETNPYGKKWAPLSPATIAEKERKGYPRAILTRTRKMRSRVEFVVVGRSVKITVPFPSQFHQRGTRKMPQRQILPEDRLSKTDERNVTDILIDYLDI